MIKLNRSGYKSGVNNTFLFSFKPEKIIDEKAFISKQDVIELYNQLKAYE